jgi:hypothetical protein
VKSLEAVALKAFLFAREKRHRVRHIRKQMVQLLGELHANCVKMNRLVEVHIGIESLGWEEMSAMMRKALRGWTEV